MTPNALKSTRLLRKNNHNIIRQALQLQARQLHTSNWKYAENTSSQSSDPSLQPSSPTSACLVTGGSSGIGYEIVKRLIADGKHSVTFVTRDSEKGQKSIQRIKEELRISDPPLDCIEVDLQKQDNVSKLWQVFQDQTAKDAQINTLINCAGLSQSRSLVATPTDEIQNILRVNLDTPIQLSRLLLKEYLRLSRRSKSQASPTSFNIVNVSSLLAYRSGSGASVYSASKAGLVAVTRALTLEAAAIRSNNPHLPPFRMNSVIPGYIDTPMIDGFSDTYRRDLEAKIPLRRFGIPSEVADAVMFLLKNEYANNTALTLDGGLSAV